MINRWTTAHARLLEQLPVRTHERKEKREPQPWRSPVAGKYGRGRAVEVNGKTFKSITYASHALRMSPKTLYQWCATGKARFV
jgi:hypothetical protein